MKYTYRGYSIEITSKHVPRRGMVWMTWDYIVKHDGIEIARGYDWDNSNQACQAAMATIHALRTGKAVAYRPTVRIEA